MGPGGKRLDVKFYWTPKYGNSSRVDILTTPQSSKGSDSRPKIMLFHFPTKQPICSGDTISLTTDDPVTRPLPHWALLEMQWILHRLTAMRGGAEIYDDFDNDDDDPMALRNEWDQYEGDEWDSYMEDDDWNSCEEESPPMLVDQPSPPSSPSQPSSSPLRKSNIRFGHIPLQPADVHQSSPPFYPPRQPSPSPLPKSNIRFNRIPLRPAENPDITMIGSSQGQ
jgi:hypothetical protein